jgi:hypothetical protein
MISFVVSGLFIKPGGAATMASAPRPARIDTDTATKNTLSMRHCHHPGLKLSNGIKAV